MVAKFSANDWRMLPNLLSSAIRHLVASELEPASQARMGLQDDRTPALA
jgi:hypothetical protein